MERTEHPLALFCVCLAAGVLCEVIMKCTAVRPARFIQVQMIANIALLFLATESYNRFHSVAGKPIAYWWWVSQFAVLTYNAVRWLSD